MHSGTHGKRSRMHAHTCDCIGKPSQAVLHPLIRLGCHLRAKAASRNIKKHLQGKGDVMQHSQSSFLGFLNARGRCEGHLACGRHIENGVH